MAEARPAPGDAGAPTDDSVPAAVGTGPGPALPPFHMERWQSTWEHRVACNLSESGVDPYTLGELLELTGLDPAALPLGYVQTNGTEALRERIAALYPGTGPENVLVTTGGAEANFLVLSHLLGPGGRAVLLEPAYAQAAGLVEGLGGSPVRVWLREERAWEPEPGGIAEAAAGRAELIVVTNPNNPTGAILPGEGMEEVTEAAARSGAWILADEVYAGAEADGRETPSFRSLSPRAIVTGSLSKAYGLPGLRLGWVVGPEELVEALWARKDYTTIAPTALSDALAARVLAPEVRPRVLERTRRIIGENLTILLPWIEERSRSLSCVPPRAGAICWVRHGRPEGSLALAERLRAEAGVLVVPGAHFGMDEFLRIGFGIPASRLAEALERMDRIL